MDEPTSAKYKHTITECAHTNPSLSAVEAEHPDDRSTALLVIRHLFASDPPWSVWPLRNNDLDLHVDGAHASDPLPSCTNPLEHGRATWQRAFWQSIPCGYQRRCCGGPRRAWTLPMQAATMVRSGTTCTFHSNEATTLNVIFDGSSQLNG